MLVAGAPAQPRRAHLEDEQELARTGNGQGAGALPEEEPGPEGGRHELEQHGGQEVLERPRDRGGERCEDKSQRGAKRRAMNTILALRKIASLFLSEATMTK